MREEVINKIVIAATIVIGLSCCDARAAYLGDLVVMNMSTPKQQEIGQVYKQILRNTRNAPPHDPLHLATVIVEAAQEYRISPRLLAAILAKESMYFVGAINKRSNDYGIAQINEHNIRAYKLSKKRLLTDIRYSVRAGARILSWFQVRFKASERTTWFCRYNVGVRSFVKHPALGRICKRYVRGVRRFL